MLCVLPRFINEDIPVCNVVEETENTQKNLLTFKEEERVLAASATDKAEGTPMKSTLWIIRSSVKRQNKQT